MKLLVCRALGADDRRVELQYWRRLLRYSCCLTLPVFMLAMVLPMMPGCEALFKLQVLGFPLDELLKWAFATPVQFWIGWRFHAGAFKALKKGRSAPACCAVVLCHFGHAGAVLDWLA